MNGVEVILWCVRMLLIVRLSICQEADTTETTLPSTTEEPTTSALTEASPSTTIKITTETTLLTAGSALTTPATSTMTTSATTESSATASTSDTTYSITSANPAQSTSSVDFVFGPWLDAVLTDSDGLCPKDFVYFTKSAMCYKVYRQPATWVDADRTCRKDKAVLVSARLGDHPHFANLSSYWLNWRSKLSVSVKSPDETGTNGIEPEPRMWYSESIYPTRGTFGSVGPQAVHRVHTIDDIIGIGRISRYPMGIQLQEQSSEHGVGDICLVVQHWNSSSEQAIPGAWQFGLGGAGALLPTYIANCAGRSEHLHPVARQPFVCEFSVEDFARFTATQHQSMRWARYSASDVLSEEERLAREEYKRKFKDCYAAFPHLNDTTYFKDAGLSAISHALVEGPDHTACYMIPSLESSGDWSYENAKNFCQQFNTTQPAISIPNLYQSRTVGQFAYSRFLKETLHALNLPVALYFGSSYWIGARRLQDELFNGTWYWDGPNGSSVEMPSLLLLNVTGDSGECLEEKFGAQELFTPRNLEALLSGEDSSFLGWNRTLCTRSPIGPNNAFSTRVPSVVCQTDLTGSSTGSTAQSRNLTVTIRKGFASYLQWANSPDEAIFLMCDLSENETIFNSPVVFLSSWFTYNSSVWRPHMTYHAELGRAMGIPWGSQFTLNIPSGDFGSFSYGSSSIVAQIREKHFCLADRENSSLVACEPGINAENYGGYMLPADYLLLRLAGYYQCGAISSSTKQWVWSEPLYVEDNSLRYPFRIRASLETIHRPNPLGYSVFDPVSRLWNFAVTAVENFTANFEASNQSLAFKQAFGLDSSVVLTVLQLDGETNYGKNETTLSGLVVLRKMNIPSSTLTPKRKRQQPPFVIPLANSLARSTQEFSLSEKFLVDRFMYSLDGHLVNAAKENNITELTEIVKFTSGCQGQTHIFAKDNLTFTWLAFRPDVTNRSYDYPVEYCPGTLYRRYCTGNREHGFTSVFREGRCTGPLVQSSVFTKELFNIQTNIPPGPEQLSALNTSVSLQTNFTIVDMRLIGQILQSSTDPKLAPMQQTSFENVYDVVNRVLQHDEKNDLSTAQSIYGTSNQFLSSMENAAFLLDTTDEVPLDRKMLSVSVFSIPTASAETLDNTMGFTADGESLTRIEQRNGTTVYGEHVDVSMVLPPSLVAHLYNESAKRVIGGKFPVRGHFLAVRSTEFLDTQKVNLKGHPGSSSVDTSFQLASWIVSASFFDITPIMNWDENITITAKVNGTMTNSSSYKCVFWNPTANNSYGEWQSEGCHFVKFDLGHVVCHCNHLTAFAVLINFRADSLQCIDKLDSPAMNGLGTAALSLSIIGLICTILILIYTKLYINTHPRVFTKNQFVIFNLCTALLFGYITFLAGIKAENDGQRKDDASCIAAGAFIHYFFLVSFCWEAVEAYLLQTTFLSTLSVHMHRFRSKTMFFCWGVPCVIVSIVVIVSRSRYLGEKYCWINATSDQDAFYGAFVAPICLVLLYNLIVFVLVIRAVSCTKKDHIRSTKNEEDLSTQLRRCISLFFLLGLPWLFLVLNAFGDGCDGQMTLYIVFNIFCGLQGFAILIVTVLGMRKELFNRRNVNIKAPSQPLRSTTASTHTLCSTSTIGAESDFYRVGSEVAIIEPASEKDIPTTVRYRRTGSVAPDSDSIPPSLMMTFRHVDDMPVF